MSYIVKWDDNNKYTYFFQKYKILGKKKIFGNYQDFFGNVDIYMYI